MASTRMFGKESFDSQIKSILSEEHINRNSCRWDPSGSTSGAASSIINFTLPTNTIIDLSTLGLCFDIVARGQSTGTAQYARLPNNLNSLLERIDVSINGIIVSSFSNYKELAHIKNITQNVSDYRSRALLNHEYIVSDDSPLNTGDTADMTGVDETYDGSGGKPSPAFCIKKFFSFLGENTMSYLDTALLGNVVLRLTLATNAVLSSTTDANLGTGTVGASGGNGTYQLSNIFMVADCIAFVDDTRYRQYVDDAFKNNGSIQMFFKNYTTTVSTTQTTRLSISSESIDTLYWTARRTDGTNSYQVQGAPTKVALPQKEVSAAGNATYQDLLVKLVSKYFTFTNRGVTSYQWKLNSALVPMYAVNMVLAYKGLLQNGHSTSLVQSFQQYITSHFVSVTKLNASGLINEKSGFNSRGTNCNIELVLNGLSSDSEVLVIVESTATLNVFPKREVTVTY